MSKGFYRAFEDKLRGSRELIKSRLGVYGPFINTVKAVYPDAQAVDLGCGRGEWLELLGENGVAARGVDLDDEMLRACRERGLDVTTGDALSLLKSIPDESVLLVSAFHLVEHVPFEVLQELVAESLRVLKPGGLMVLETPNPENLAVGTSNFYLDPTHVNPIPPALLSFIPEYYGFARVKVLRLQECAALVDNKEISLWDVLQGVSPDYAVVAQKDAPPDVMAATGSPFDKEYGLTLHNLAAAYDKRQAAQISEVREQLASIYASHSWKLSAPLRWIERACRKCKRTFPLQRLQSSAWKILVPVLRVVKRTAGFILKRCPPLMRLAKKTLGRFPVVMRLVRRIERSGIDYETLAPSREGTELFIDVTHVFTEDLRTGIQRVVRSVSAEIEQEFLPGIKAEPVYLTDAGGYWHYRYVNGFADDTEIVVPKKDDIFLGLDLNARIVGGAQAGLFQDWKRRGTKVNFVVYDILPIEHPEWWAEDVGRNHEEWLRSVIDVSDVLICISQSVCESVRTWALVAGYESAKIPVMKSFHLGADVENSLPSRGIPDNGEQVLAELKAGPSFLMVGTVEPRKGHSLVLSAFEELWASGAEVKLVIVGKQGWLVDNLAKKLRNHPQLGRHLFWLEGASDEYLDKIYDSAVCLIAASEGEGFGLPLIEAAQHKLPIIARDIPVFREVAGNHCFYFSGNTGKGVADSLNAWLELYGAGQHPTSSSMPWLTWKQSAKQLKDIVATQFIS